MSFKRVHSGVRKIPTVLLVDDRRTNLLCLRLALESGGYRLLTADDGASALGLCRIHPIDLVVLDVMMPGLDGIEVAERLRSMPATAKTPIVFVTAAPNEVARFSQCDADDVAVMAKPFDAAALAQTVARMLAAAEGAQLAGGL